MFQRLRDGLLRFMAGRNGVDELNIFLLGVGMVFCLVGSFGGLALVYLLAYVPLLLAIFRMFSRNVARRRAENARLQRLLARLRDRSHRYFRCPNCRQTVRVPKGKGKISIRCPRCGQNFVKKS